MKIVKLKLTDQLQRRVSGKFAHLHVEDGKAWLTGGAARSYLMAMLGMEWEQPHDFDFTVMGKAATWSRDRAPRRNRRVEVEYESGTYSTIGEFFFGRDFAINQVVVDSKGNLYATKQAIASFRSGVLLSAVTGRKLSQRELDRAVKFSKRYALRLPRDIKAALSKNGGKPMN